MITSKNELMELISDDEGEKVYQLNLPPLKKRLRADKVLVEYFDALSRSQLQKLFDEGRVWSDDTVITKSDKLSGDQIIQLTIPSPKPLDLTPADIPLSIIYEDEDIVVINKSAGMVVHPGAGTGSDTLVHALLYHCAGQLSGIGGVERPGIVHRLDKETSGVIVVAKTDTAFQGIAQQFAERSTEKFYKAIVQGIPSKKGEIDQPIGRHSVIRMKMQIREDGRSARSSFILEKVLGLKSSLLGVQIHTGRTHQIRVHLGHLNHPILGDGLYGFKQKGFPVQIPRVMLHAAELRVTHPIRKERMVFHAPLPLDFLTVINELGEAIS